MKETATLGIMVCGRDEDFQGSGNLGGGLGKLDTRGQTTDSHAKIWRSHFSSRFSHHCTLGRIQDRSSTRSHKIRFFCALLRPLFRGSRVLLSNLQDPLAYKIRFLSGSKPGHRRHIRKASCNGETAMQRCTLRENLIF